MSCGSACSSGSCCVAYPTFSGCGFLTFFVFSYVLPYIFLFSLIVFFVICTVCCRVPVLMRPSGTTRHVGSSCPVLLALVSTLSFYGLLPRRLISSLFLIDRHSVVWPCLPRSWDPPAFRLRRLSLQDCCFCAFVRFWLFCTFTSHLTLTGT